ncbi:MAG: AmmeMemoRadiSam system radical SAM enzyme [Candidatus Riflebacteria bacterium]|nr:AmmeMemoRadiSam system radical SAM enzyme [Candidatus Riflebacteria bacterium]
MKKVRNYWSIDRRSFIKRSSLLAGVCMLGRGTEVFAGNESDFPAEYVARLDDGRLQCTLCPNLCTPVDGENGACRARGIRNGTYVSLVHSLPCVIAVDPVEKMPLFHYHVHGPALAISTAGCNLFCQYCQNWQFSQKSPAETSNFAMSPEDIVMRAIDMQIRTIGFFYTEPTIYIEYMKDIARLAKKRNIKTVMVTAGYINPEPLKDLFELIDIFVVGYKGFTEEFYAETIGGKLDPVKKTLIAIKESGRHLEIVSLLIPEKNDDMKAFQAGAEWFVENLGTDVPWHFSRFAPEFMLKNLPPTPNGVLEMARTLAIKAGVKYAYTGNNPGQEGNHTYCPGCSKKVVERLGFKVLRSFLSAGKCPDCGYQIPGVWLDDLPNGNI